MCLTHVDVRSKHMNAILAILLDIHKDDTHRLQTIELALMLFVVSYS